MYLRNIIFDLGGVLIDWNPKYVFDELIPDPEKRAFFFENVCTHAWNVQQDAGRSILEATESKIEEYPEFEELIRAYYDRWEDMLGGPIQDTVDYLKELIATKKYRIYALTNWSRETFPVALEKYDFLGLFEGIVVSGVEHMKKPDKEIYDLMLKRYSISGNETIFIDDNINNVEGARSAGIHSLHFETASKLRNDLEALLAKRLY